MGAVDVEDEDRPRRADELPLCRVRLAGIGAAFQHPGVAMRAGHDARGAVVAREVDQGADRMTGIPHVGYALARPVDMQGLLAVSRPQAARPESRETACLAEDVPDRREHAR